MGKLADIRYHKHNPTSPPITAIPSLWERAFNKLSDEDKNTLSFSGSNEKLTLESIVEATRKSRDVCVQNRVKFRFRGKDIIIRDVADKLLTWIDKFKAIGDIATQFDAVHTALPWAGIRFLLQVYLLPLLNCGFNANEATDCCKQ